MASLSKKKRTKVHDKCNGKCIYCDVELKDPEIHGYNHPHVFEVDHLNPKSKGGSLSANHNLVPSCKKCNRSKGPDVLHNWLKRVDDRISEIEQEIEWLETVSKNINKKFRLKNG